MIGEKEKNLYEDSVPKLKMGKPKTLIQLSEAGKMLRVRGVFSQGYFICIHALQRH